MSRALDKDTTAALKSGDPEAAYRAISEVLMERPAESTRSSLSAALAGRLEIEFLSPGQFRQSPENTYVLRDENAVGIPKLALVQAFFVARNILRKYQSVSTQNSIGKPRPTADDVLAATAVILLMDPEHLTAANTRKRIIQAQIDRISKGDNASAASSNLGSVLADELYLIDSFLTSYLHRHTKSPTLWSHRRWLVSLSLASHGPICSTLEDISNVVMVAAVRHPRNYYAWEHARWLVMSNGFTPGRTDNEVSHNLIVSMRDWCCRHHNDTSGWSFLFFLLSSLAHPPLTSSPPASSSLYADTLSHVERMATSLRWTGESVWVFLRTAVAYLDKQQQAGSQLQETEEYKRFQTTAVTLQGHLDPACRDYQVLQEALNWCAVYSNRQGRHRDAT